MLRLLELARSHVALEERRRDALLGRESVERLLQPAQTEGLHEVDCRREQDRRRDAAKAVEGGARRSEPFEAAGEPVELVPQPEQVKPDVLVTGICADDAVAVKLVLLYVCADHNAVVSETTSPQLVPASLSVHASSKPEVAT